MDRIGKYELLGELGKGGMGVVYKAYDSVIGREVAIKVMQQGDWNDPIIKKRFYREARSAGRLSHPNITILYDVGEEDDTPYLVMEFLEGCDLRTLLKAGTIQSTSQKLAIAAQICSGLLYAHEKEIVHRDIKPENIRVLPNGSVKIMDFGIARIQSEAMTLTQTDMLVGTPRYMAPEQVKGKTVDHRADIFSFGVLLYELLTGTNPFGADNVTTVIYKILHTEPEPMEIVPDSLCGELQVIVEKCLAKELEDRYAHFGEVLQAIEAVSLPEGETLSSVRLVVPSMPPPTKSLSPSTTFPPASLRHPSSLHTEPLQKPPRSRKGLWITLSILVIAGLAVGGYVFFPFLFQSDPTPEVATLRITPSAATLAVSEVVNLRVELHDAEGTLIEAPYLQLFALHWTSADSTTAAVVGTSTATSLGGAVVGRKGGATTVTVTVGDLAQSVAIAVTVPNESISEAQLRYLHADSLFRVVALTDSVVLAFYERLRNDIGYALGDSQRTDVDQTIQHLSDRMTTFTETTALDQGDSLSILELRARWQAYLDQGVREDQSTQQAEQRIGEIDEVMQRTALLEAESLALCDQAVPGG